ncbi:hypothetical protein [Kitasatospora sp. NPDC094015]|uniref:hypothetical protein n=1 Tax=Kitasatospora sp. NPDC094015 TaxID=3155205 RepID=UPI003332FAFF
MSLIAETLPHIAGGLSVAVLLGSTSWAARRIRARRTAPATPPAAVPDTTGGADTTPAHPPVPATRDATAAVRTYTFLGTLTAGGRPVRRATTRPAGSVTTLTIDGHTQNFQLTDIPLGDNTFAAEPLD